MPILQLAGIVKRFDKKVAVNSLSLSIPAGELYVFLGPNGAGKTTTMKISTGLLRPDAGTVLIHGKKVQEYIGADNALPFSYVPEEPHLYERFTAREFFRFIGETANLAPDVVDGRVELYGRRLGVMDFIDEAAVTYSHGMRQRVAVTGALLNNPSLLIIDEPMVGLDPAAALALKQILKELTAQGASVLLSTHTLPIAQELADRIGVMNFGKMIVEGAPDSLAAPGETLEDVFLRYTSASNEK